MTFANRAILVGLLALGIPLAIHLLGRRRARKVVLPTARFAEGAHASSRGRLWLKRVALLALRLAVVALLVLALAGPRIGSDPAHQPWVLVLDTSPSMHVKGPDGVTALERGRRHLLAVAEAMPDDRPTMLLTSHGRTEGITAAQARQTLKETPVRTRAQVPLRQIIADAIGGVAAAGTDVKVAAAEAPRRTAPSHVVIATDATPHALQGMAAGRFATHQAQVVLLPVGGAEANVWLGLPKVRIVDSDAGRLLNASVEVRSEPGRKSVKVALKLDGRETEHAAVVSVAGAATFKVPVDGEGPWQGRVYVTADDALSADNARYFTVAARRPIRVLVVDAAGEDDVRLRSADLVAAAFVADAGVPKPATRLTAAEVDRAALDGADIVFWLGSQAPRDLGELKRHVSGGGGLVWIPADSRPPQDTVFSDWLGLQGQLRVDESPDGVTIDPAGYTSDLLGAFEGGTGGDLSAPVLRRRLCLPRSDRTVIRFRDAWPAIQTRWEGKGRVVVLAFGPSPYWGDLAGRVEFVVLVHSLAEALVPAGGPQVANLIAGAVAQFRPVGYEDAPGNYISPGEDGPETRYSVNIDPNETADLAPQPDRLAATFAEDRVQVVTGHFSPKSAIPALARPPGTDLSPLAIVALALALAAESLLSASQSGPLWRRSRRG